jgi:hypothetical protein
MTPVIINIDLDKPCKGCGEKGAADSGYCLECIAAIVIAKTKADQKAKKGLK